MKKIVLKELLILSISLACWHQATDGLPLSKVNEAQTSSNKWWLREDEKKYPDPNEWPNLFPLFCAGKQQSPINIDPRTAENGNFPLFTFGNYENSLSSWKITNNGHSPTYSLKDVATDQLPYIEGGGLSDRYIFAQFHFHWGGKALDAKDPGSEHTLRSRQYPAELHLVHYNSKYGSLGLAVGQPDGLAVLGIFMQAGGLFNSSNFNPVLKPSNSVADDSTNDESPLSSPLALGALLPGRTSSFFRYSGSLTTPVCSEVVTWTVFDDPITISQAQLTHLRALVGEAGEEPNFRPVQPLEGRTVYYRSSFGDNKCNLPSFWPISPTPLSDLYSWFGCFTGLFSLFEDFQ